MAELAKTRRAPKPTPVVPAVVQAVEVLRCLAAADRGMSVTAMARATGISQSSCFNLLRTLTSQHLVNFDDDSKLYTLGLGVVELASRLLSHSQQEMIWPELERISRAYGALLALWQIGDDERMVLIDRIYSDAPLRIEIRIGQRVPSFAGAVGRCVAAASRVPPDQLRVRFKKLIWQSPITFEEYAKQVERAAQDGFAVDDGQYFKGVSVVGTAIVDAEGQPRQGIGALTIAGQLSKDELRSLGQTLHATAQLLGRIWYPAKPQSPQPAIKAVARSRR